MGDRERIFSVIIPIDDPSTSAEHAISGVLTHKKRIRELYLVYPGYQDDERSMYKGWVAHRKILGDDGIHIHIESTLDASKVDPEAILIRISPYCELKMGAYDAVYAQMQAASASQMRGGLFSVTELQGLSPLYGFFVVLQTITWFWNRVWERNKLFQFSDVRSTVVLTKGRRRFLPDDSSFFWRFLNPTTMPGIYCPHAVNRPPSDPTWTLRNHLHVGFGLWILVYVGLWFIMAVGVTSILSIRTSIFEIGIPLSAWITSSLVSYATCKDYLVMRHRWIYHALFPFYFVLFPFMVMYSRN